MNDLKPAPHINPHLALVLLFCRTNDGKIHKFCKKSIMDSALTLCGLKEIDPNENKIFISGPMTGYEFHNYPLFNTIEDLLRIAGYKCVNPAKIGMKYDP